MDSRTDIPVKPQPTNVWKVFAIVLTVISVVIIGGFVGGGVYYVLKVPRFTPTDISNTLKDCTQCEECMSCLTKFSSHNLVTDCKILENSFQCSAQIMFLYGKGKSEEQPCHSQCTPCSLCLSNTPFGKMRKLEQSLWTAVYSNISHLQTQRKQRKRRAIIDDGDKCCGTSREIKVLINPVTDASDGTVWYPVWLCDGSGTCNYQWYYEVTCASASKDCTNKGCAKKDLKHSVLMTTTAPISTYGHYYSLIMLPDSTVKFRLEVVTGYCKCVNL